MSGLQWATIIAGSFFLAILIWVLVLNSKRKSSESSAGAGKQKMGGKNWNWVILIAIISGIIGACLIVPKYYGKAKVSQINAVFSWEKEPSQYGSDPEIRRSVPMEAVITQNDATFLNFVFYYSHRGTKEKGIFEGEKTANGRIEGTWRQDRPKDGGEWYLEQNSPRLFTGKHMDRSGDWIPMKLKIKLN